MKILATISLLFITAITFATDLDSLIVEFKITDKETKEPVVAKIVYESQPYGTKIGIRKASNLEFMVEFDEKYMVKIEAAGYQSENLSIDYHEFGGAGHIIEEIELIKGGGKGHVMVLEALKFGQASAIITEAGHEELNGIAETMKQNSKMVIQLEGHTDFHGDPKLNMKLSQDRVKAARDYLVSRGISKGRIKIKAFGGDRPVSRGNSAVDRAKNRRVELRILEN